MTKLLFSSPLVVGLAWLVTPTATALDRKMVIEPVEAGHRLLAHTTTVSESSSYAALIGHCSPNSPLRFPVSAGEGKGMIGLMDNTNVLVTLDCDAGKVELDPVKQSNIFSVM